MEMKLSEFECADCGATINEGEYVTFGVCDKCFQKNYRERMGLPEEKKNTMETKERIEEAAESWFQKLPWVESYKIPLIKEAHIAGATTENGLLSKEIELLRNENNYLKNRIREYIKG